jgi:hypothetical protein
MKRKRRWEKRRQKERMKAWRRRRREETVYDGVEERER